MKTTKNIYQSIRFSRIMFDDAKQLAESQGMSIGDWIRLLVANALRAKATTRQFEEVA